MQDLSKLKKQTFLQGAIVLVVANLLTKVIGAIFKIPLANVLDENGMGIYNSAYQCYVFCFIIATAGIPIAVSKMVSENMALGKTRNVDRIFRIEMMLITGLGALGAVALLLFADQIAAFMEGADGTALSIRIIAPALIFVAIMSGLRGYFQGMQNMFPTAISEVLEAAGKPVFGLVLAYYFINSGMKYAAGGAITGVTVGTVIGATFILWMYRTNKKSMRISDLPKGEVSAYRDIFKTLVWIAIPITIGACVSSLTTLADTLFIRRILMGIEFTADEAQALFNRYSSFAGSGEFDVLLSQLKLDKTAANWLYGSYSGYAMTVYNLPLALITAVATCVVPALSGAFAGNKKRESNMIIASSIRITVLFSLPCTVGLSALATPILTTLYGTDASAGMLQVLSFAIVWVTLVSVTTSILQAAGKVWLPVIHMVIGAVVKIAASYIFIGIPSVNILGASISTVLCYFVIAALNIFAVMRATGFRFSVANFVLKPVIASGAMGIVTVAVYKVCANLLPATRMGAICITAASIAVAAVTYVLMVVLLRIIRQDDIKLLPKGEKLAAILEKRGIIKE